MLALAAFPRHPVAERGEVLGQGSHNKVHAVDEARVLRVGTKPPRSLEKAEATVREAVFAVLMGRARIGPKIYDFGWNPDGRAWSVQERGMATLGEWLEAIVKEPRRMQRWRSTTAPSLIAAIRRTASFGFFAGDVKPENVLIMQGGAVRIIDFDLAYAVWSTREEGESCDHAYLLTLALMCFHVYQRVDRLVGTCDGALAADAAKPLRKELLAAGRRRLCLSIDCSQQDVDLAFLPLDGDEEGHRFHERLRHYFGRKPEKPGADACHRQRRTTLLQDVGRANARAASPPIVCAGKLGRAKDAIEDALQKVRGRVAADAGGETWDAKRWRGHLLSEANAARARRGRSPAPSSTAPRASSIKGASSTRRSDRAAPRRK